MLSFKYSRLGGNLSSICLNGKERQYQPDPRSWQGQDVVIFPFVARLKGQSYTVDGKTYSMKNHGLARYNEFEVIEDTPEHAELLFVSNEETRKQYPYDFSCRVIYKVEGDSLFVSYVIENKNECVMPFGIGGHPALKVDAIEKEDETDISGNKIVFPEEMDLTMIELDETGSFIRGKRPFCRVKEIPLSKALFVQYNTLMFEAEGIKTCKLVKRSGEEIEFHFDTIRYLAIWSHPKFGDYVCIEPWMSLPDFENAPKEMMEKETLLHLDPKKTFTFSYTICF